MFLLLMKSFKRKEYKFTNQHIYHSVFLSNFTNCIRNDYALLYSCNLYNFSVNKTRIIFAFCKFIRNLEIKAYNKEKEKKKYMKLNSIIYFH